MKRGANKKKCKSTVIIIIQCTAHVVFIYKNHTNSKSKERRKEKRYLMYGVFLFKHNTGQVHAKWNQEKITTISLIVCRVTCFGRKRDEKL